MVTGDRMKKIVDCKTKDIIVTENCFVKLISLYTNEKKTIRVSKVNGFDDTWKLKGHKKGNVVLVENEYWKIAWIDYDKKKKFYKRKYSLLSHPLNNKTRIIR